MKRVLGLTFVVVACIIGFLSIRGTLPFMPIFGSSMEPTLQSGGLLMIEPIEPQNVKAGDIIVYNVPSMIREYYGYPPVVAHRVIEVRTTPSLSFRTAGDNTGEDPFTIRPGDLRGTVGDQIPYLGLPLLFFQSQQGVIFVIIALALLAFFLYGGEISHGGNILHRSVFSPVINEEKRANRLLTRKIESTEQRMNSTEQALEKFAAAIELYAQHLSSHTSAIQGLSEASHELKRGAAEQNRVLMNLMEAMQHPGTRAEGLTPRMEPPVPEAEKSVPELENLALMRMKATHEQQKILFKKEQPAPHIEKPTLEEEIAAPEADQKQSPPGCARRRPLTAEEILDKLRKPKF
jgi:signal peptidase